ncbi:uncharacterized protein HMPREF1541_08294 [Cyphellophora europaea CBS 101466]|uniref:Carboxylic ester hydrolase n=1 Tax=Cyphellophora europaea (strain CBS 101466) TaxID=1220924 RepID=W2RNM9_CYPE1|nr:uncharacterized protein HMPREF1541_08294 [Cyphellophora europaea CBS 101466]ETN37303.1 hypothetical protein HMPREF1541_08294 [Cyphellophora europaea CBS 101466]
MNSFALSVLLALAPFLLPFSALAQTSDAFPTINLGYARHAATYTNLTSANLTYGTYANIRFAQPPIGPLRFRAPVTPPPISAEVQTGLVPINSTNCLQAIPSYFPAPLPINGTSWGSEDCLFLDVIVPAGLNASSPAPVLHWLYGGGFFYGAKDWSGNPAALLATADAATEPFIIVASNYRLGALGWMSSETEPELGVNIGLYDAQAALQWTRQYIGLFGGDPERVTVMGQSAGAGIVEHLLAAGVGGQQGGLFQQAVLSSPGYRPHVNRSLEMTEIYKMFLNATGCADVECLRGLSEEDLAAGNAYLLMDTQPEGWIGPSISFGPVIDRQLVKSLPDWVLNETDVGAGGVRRIIAGGMKNDGVASIVAHPTSWTELLDIFARTPTNSTLEALEEMYGTYMNQTSFTPDGDITPTPFDEACGELIYTCHSYFPAKTFSNNSGGSHTARLRRRQTWQSEQTRSYRYEMSILPALHGQDLSYYFYDDVVAAADPTVNASVAATLQSYLRSFILGHELDGWPEYSSEGLERPSWVNITASGFEPVVGEDEAVTAERCQRLIELFGNGDDGW